MMIGRFTDECDVVLEKDSVRELLRQGVEGWSCLCAVLEYPSYGDAI